MNSISVEELGESDTAIIIDVREPDEYAAGHARTAVNMPVGQLEQRLAELPTDRAVHVICQSGGRSARATEMLAAHGIDAVDVSGGTAAWIAAGLQVERS